MAYYGGFQRNAFQNNAFQILGSGSTPPVIGAGDIYILRRRRRRYAWITWLSFIACMAPSVVA